MKKVLAIGSGDGWHVRDLRRAATELGIDFRTARFSTIEAELGPRERVTAGGIDLTEYNAVLARMMPPGNVETIVYRMDALHQAARLGVRIVNPPAAIEAAIDKFATLAKVRAEGLPVPETWVGEDAMRAMDAYERLGGDVVVKPIFGSEGRGLMRINDSDLAARAFSALERLGAVFYLQKFYESSCQDLRIFVVDNHVFAAIRRRARDGDWRANVARGAIAEPIEPGAELGGLAVRAAASIGAEVCGVDILPTADGPLIVEVNAVPGWRGLAGATGLDPARAILIHATRRP